MGACAERAASRPGLCTVLCRYDPVEVVAPNTLSPATLSVLSAHARPAGAAGAGEGAALSRLPPSLAGDGGAGGKAVLSRALPPTALRAVVELLPKAGPVPAAAPAARGRTQHHGTAAAPGAGGGGPEDGTALRQAAIDALALALKQLERCGLADELLPTLQFAPLEVGTAPAAAPAAAAGAAGGSRPAGGGSDGAGAQPPPRQHMLLDDRALRTLHVLQGPLGERRGSLLEALDTTASAGGRRRLRQWLCRCVAPQAGAGTAS